MLGWASVPEMTPDRPRPFLGRAVGMRRIKGQVRRIVVLALLAVLGLMIAGCGGTKKAVVTAGGPVPYHGPCCGATSVVNSGSAAATHRFIIGGTLTIPNVKTGTLIRCKGWKGKYVLVPQRGSSLEVGEAVKLSGTVKKRLGTESELMSLTHRENGAITVACQLVEPR